MKYYEEELMGALREMVEAELLSWPDVSTKKMFGCPSYKVGDKLFAFLVTDGLVLIGLPDELREKLLSERGGTHFTTGNRTMKTWVRMPLETPDDLPALMELAGVGYDRLSEAE